MAQPRAFDHDRLRELLAQHPDWSNQQLADELTKDNIQRGGSAKPVNGFTVQSVINRRRDEWGATLRQTHSYQEIAPPDGALAARHRMNTLMRYLRDIAAEQRGDVAVGEHEEELRQSALSWKRRMRADLTVVDLAEGKPFVRPARPDEINAKGDLISLMAWKVPVL